jgi:hypothetical protein
MLRRLRPRSIYDLFAVVALFVAVGTGGAYAANTVFSSDIVDNQVYSADVRDDNLSGGGLSGIDIANNAISSADVRDDNLGFGGLTRQDLGPGSVASSEVQDNSLTGSDIIESSLAKVPDADKLDGIDSSGFARKIASGAVSFASESVEPGGCAGASTSAVGAQETDSVIVTRVLPLTPFDVTGHVTLDEITRQPLLEVEVCNPTGSTQTLPSFSARYMVLR